MSTLRERISALKVTVTSPDGQIKARVVGEDDVTLAFRDDAYDKYGERELEHQLGRLADLAWVAHRRGYLQILDPDSPTTETEQNKDHWDAKYRRYYEDIANMVGKGVASSGLLEVRSKGLALWKVRIKDGALKQLDEQQFIREAVGAFRQVKADSESKRILLKDEHFGLNLPPKARG